MSPAQLDLFAAPVTAAPSRASDPPTSKIAGKALPLRARQQEVVEALRWLGVSSTADEVRRCLREHSIDRERNEVASRLSELERLEVVCKAGVKKNHKGRDVAAWRLR